MDADLDTLLIALYVELADHIIPGRDLRTGRGPGRPPLVTDAEIGVSGRGAGAAAVL